MSTTESPSKSSEPSKGQKIAAVVVAVLVGLFLIGKCAEGDKPQDPSTAAEIVQPRATPLAANVDGFRKAIPLLMQRPMQQKTRASDNATLYQWDDLSMAGHPNWLMLDDLGGDGVVESGMLCVVAGRDQAQTFEALALAMRVIETASGTSLQGDNNKAYVEWFMTGLASGKAFQRTFGTVAVDVAQVQIQGQSMLMIGLNRK